MNDKPQLCFDLGCPLATKGKGFVLGVGDPRRAKLAVVLEAPGSDEIQFPLRPVVGRQWFSTQAEVDAELATRRRDYPLLEERFLKMGVPVVGASGVELNMWAFPAAGLRREELFIDNTLRCLPPRGKMGAYPTKDDRKLAEKCCRAYDRVKSFAPDVLVASLHPAGILREVTPLPLQVKDLEKARDFVAAGRRVMLLLGGKAVKAFMRCCENVTKFRGTYLMLPPKWGETYTRLFEFTAKVKRVKGEPRTTPIKKRRTKADAAFDAIFEHPNAPKKMRRARSKAVAKI